MAKPVIGKITWYSGDDVNQSIAFRTERTSRLGDHLLLNLLSFEPLALFPELEEPDPIYVISKAEGDDVSYSSPIDNAEHADHLFTLVNAGLLS